MKRILICLLVAVSALTASAELRWGATAGMNISNYSWSQDLVSSSHKVGPNVGLTWELMVPGIGFGFDWSVKYAMHGSDITFGQQPVWSEYGKESTLWQHTVQIPVNLRFKWTRMNGAEHYAAPFVYGGPVFTFNVASSNLPMVEIPTGSAGLQCGIGGEFFERYQLSAGYLWGLSYDVRTLKLDNFTGCQRGWQINAAILF